MPKSAKTSDQATTGLAGSKSKRGVEESPRKRFAFRALTVAGIPLALMLLLEGVLRLAGYGYSPGFFLQRTEAGRSIWTENPAFGRRFFPPGLQRAAQPLRMADPKPAQTLRVFVLGESAAMGDPDFKFGLPRMLEVLLRERVPERRVEVINAAVVAINSHVILPIAKDCARKQGDLWIIYLGNNEVVGPFGSASVFGARAPAWPLVRAGLWLKSTRLGQLFDSALYSLRRPHSALPEWGGMGMMANERVSHDSRAARSVYANFQRNLADILQTGSHAGVPMVLCTMPANLRDCAPFASLHRWGLTPAQLSRWQTAYDAGSKAQEKGDLTNALAFYSQAAEIDFGFADLAFRQGEISLGLGLKRESTNYFQRALDCDALQFRADSTVNLMIRQAATAFAGRRVSLLDAQGLFASNSPLGVPGTELFYEHVHLTPEGNYLLARAAAEQAIQALELKPTGTWLSQADCFRLIGLTEWNRYAAYTTILDRIQGAPFTNQLDHARQMAVINEQLSRYKLATKPAQVQRLAIQVSQLVQKRPDDPDLRWNLASLLQSCGDYRGAEEQWRALLELQPHAPLPAFNLARLLESLNRPTEALPLYEHCLKYNEDQFPAQYACGRLYLQLGAFPQAIEHLQFAVRQKPASVDSRVALAQALAGAQKPYEAQKQWREVLRLDPENTAASKALGASTNQL